MAKILITGMSGTGKSTALLELGHRGHRVVDTDSDDWCEWVTLRDQNGQIEHDWIWREDRMRDLLADHTTGMLYVAGCKSNQGKFYDQFDAVVLLSAPTEVLFERITARDTNDYGKSLEDRALILEHIATIEPLLRRTSTAVIDAAQPLEEVVDQLELIARTAHHPESN